MLFCALSDTPADLAAVLAIEQSQQRYPWSARQWQDSLRQHRCFCLRSDNNSAPIAYAVLHLVTPEAELLNLAVEQPHQGHAHFLWLGIREWAQQQQITRLFLEVAESNHHAIAVYAHWGFKVIHTRKNYYRHQHASEHAKIMEWQSTINHPPNHLRLG